MDRAWDAGITWFDTGDAYGGGTSERWIGEWIARARRCGRSSRPRSSTRRPGRRGTTGSRRIASGGRSRVELERLGVERVDFYLAHEPDPAVPLGETVACFESLRDQGLIGAWGLSNYDLARDPRHGARARAELVLAARSRRRGGRAAALPRARDPVRPVRAARGRLADGQVQARRGVPRRLADDAAPGPYEQLRRRRGVRRARSARATRPRRAASSMAALAFAWVLHRCDGAVCGPNRAAHLDPVLEAMQIEIDERRRRSDRRVLPMSQVRVLDEHDVRRLLPMADCIDAMDGRAALARARRGLQPAAPGLPAAERAEPDGPDAGAPRRRRAVVVAEGVDDRARATARAASTRTRASWRSSTATPASRARS